MQNTEDIPRVLGGLGTAIISTNKGVVTDKEARKLGVGGEVLCFVGNLNPLSTEETPSPLNSWETSLSVEVYFRTKLESTSLSAQCN